MYERAQRKCEVTLPLMAIRQPEPKKGEAAAAWCLTVRRSLSFAPSHPSRPKSPQGTFFLTCKFCLRVEFYQSLP